MTSAFGKALATPGRNLKPALPLTARPLTLYLSGIETPGGSRRPEGEARRNVDLQGSCYALIDLGPCEDSWPALRSGPQALFKVFSGHRDRLGKGLPRQNVL